MVVGLDKFREHFADHADHYAVIGGTACSMIFEEVGIGFRQTDDIDMVRYITDNRSCLSGRAK